MPDRTKQKLSQRSVRERDRLLTRDILPALGKPDAEKMRRDIGAKRLILANRVQQICHAALRSATAEGLPNPVAVGRKNANHWFEEGETVEPLTRGGTHDVIHFLALSGLRKTEALTLRRDAVDLDSGEVRLGHAKTGRSARASQRTLSDEALNVL